MLQTGLGIVLIKLNGPMLIVYVLYTMNAKVLIFARAPALQDSSLST